MSPLVPGTTIGRGRYRLDEILGRGGMAVVWRATDLQLERTVAIKIISDVLALDPSFTARFEREARLAASLSHPNVVKVFNYSVEDDRPYLVMEYIPGGTLSEARGRPLDTNALARALLDAVAHMHAAGILHRDIKPANVLLGADGTPYLTDFGVARSDEATGLTQPGQVLGTHGYIAPEVIAGRPATVQSDLFSVGALLREVAPRPQEPLAGLIRRLTDADPAQRPRSAAEALTELDPTTALPPTHYVPAEPPTEPIASEDGRAPSLGPVAISRRQPVSRRQAIAAGLALLALLAVVVAAASGGGSSRKPAVQLQPLPAGTPAGAQVDQLERIVRAAPRKR